MSDTGDKLPDNVIPITTLRINYDKKKKCTCRDTKFEVDYQNKEVICTECGSVVQPFDAICKLAQHYDRVQAEVRNLLDQRKQILNWKPWLLPVRDIERIYRGGDMLPCCPHCGRGILAGEMTSATNKQIELERRKFEKKQGRRGDEG